MVAQAAVRANATAQAVAMARNSAAGFNGWYDTDRITAWAVGLAAQIEALQRFLAQTTDAYLARVFASLTGGPVRPIGRVDIDGLRTGVTHAGAYGRAADVYRWQQAQFDRSAKQLLTAVTPAPFTLIDPVAAAVERVAKVADLDAQLAVRAQSQAVMTDQHGKGTVTGYRRVIHPEESSGGSCGLCVAASDRLYSAHEPMPVHSRCHCTTLPVVNGQDPGSTLNRADLSRLYKTAGGKHRSKLAGVRYQVDEHGELGPMLNPAGAKVRSARQAGRDANSTRRGKLDAEKHADLVRVRDSVSRALPKARELAGADPKTWGDYLTKLEARVSDLDHQLAA